jgi:hypothetical protein
VSQRFVLRPWNRFFLRLGRSKRRNLHEVYRPNGDHTAACLPACLLLPVSR